MAEEEALRKLEKPVAGHAEATTLALKLFGHTIEPGSIKELDSYDDRNFYFRATTKRPELCDVADGHAVADEGGGGTAPSGAFHFVLKVHNGVESLNSGFIECQNLAMEAVRAPPARRLSSTNDKCEAMTCLPIRPDQRDSWRAMRGPLMAEPTIMPNKDPKAPSLNTTSWGPSTGSTLIGSRVHSAHVTARSTQSGTSGRRSSEDAPSQPLVNWPSTSMVT